MREKDARTEPRGGERDEGDELSLLKVVPGRWDGMRRRGGGGGGEKTAGWTT